MGIIMPLVGPYPMAVLALDPATEIVQQQAGTADQDRRPS